MFSSRCRTVSRYANFLLQRTIRLAYPPQQRASVAHCAPIAQHRQFPLQRDPKVMASLASIHHRAFLFSAFAICAAVSGCQTNPLANTPWSSASRVPPPNAPSVMPSAPYGGPVGAASPSSPVAPSRLPGGGNPQASATNPLLDPVVQAQNQLKAATDNARMAVAKSTDSINSSVQQAGARLDRIGEGVVQASGTIQSALQDPLPFPPVIVPPASPAGAGSFAPDPSGIPGTGGYASSAVPMPSTGAIGDATPIDPNAQWVKPTPR
jgi:hypothetical protein